MDVYSREKRSAIMRAVRTKATAPEQLLRSRLHRLGFRFGANKSLPGKPDVVLPKYRSVVFVHGCFWHGHSCSRAKIPEANREFWDGKISRNRDRDRRVERQLADQGWKVYTVWQCELGSESKRLRTIDWLQEAIKSSLA